MRCERWKKKEKGEGEVKRWKENGRRERGKRKRGAGC